MIEPGKWKILLVDDDADGREAMCEWLDRRGYNAQAVGTAQETLDHLYEGVAVVVTDLKMPGIDGLELLRLIKQQAPHVAVILVSGHGTVDSAVTALKEGACDFLTKPVNLKELQHRIDMALEKQAMAAQIAELRTTKKN